MSHLLLQQQHSSRDKKREKNDPVMFSVCRLGVIGVETSAFHHTSDWAYWAVKRFSKTIYYVCNGMSCQESVENLTLGSNYNDILWSAICKIIPWAKVNSLCHMSIFIHVASENFCAMPASIYNMGNCIFHMLTFINFMCKLICERRYLICFMFRFICDASWSIYDISILLWSMSETLYVMSKSSFVCLNSFITWATIVLTVSILLHPVCYVVFAKSFIYAQDYMWHGQNYLRHLQIYLLTFTIGLFLDMTLAWDPTFIRQAKLKHEICVSSLVPLLRSIKW